MPQKKKIHIIVNIIWLISQLKTSLHVISTNDLERLGEVLYLA